MAPTGFTRLAAVIGSPVRHSRSPAIHNAAFEAAGLDWVYVALDVAPRRGSAALDAMRVLGIGGLSVTMPHKAEVANAVDRPSAAVVALGACNCVYWDGGELAGDNTDGDGFVSAHRHQLGTPLTGARVSVVGAGGAARAIIEALGRAGVASVHVWSRSVAAAERAASLHPVVHAGPIEEVADSEIIVNATPVGMAGGPNPHAIPVPADLIGEHHIVHDIVYEPRETPLMVAARQRGATVVGGAGMLVHQAARQFTHWTGKPAPLGAMMQAVLT